MIEQPEAPESLAPHGVAIYNINPGTVRIEMMLSIISIQNYEATHDNNLVGVYARPGTSSPAIMRDAAARHFLNDTTAEWQLFIDSDIETTPDLVSTMLECADPFAAPIICGLYITALPEGLVPLMYHPEDDRLYTAAEYLELEAAGRRLVPVSRTGAGCLLVHRDVYLKMCELNPVDPWFGETVIDGTKYGEDFTFCRRARAAGYPIFVDIGVNTWHLKDIALHKGMLGQVAIETRTEGPRAPSEVPHPMDARPTVLSSSSLPDPVRLP